MPSASKMVSDRVLVSRTVLSSLKTHGPVISADLETLLFPNGSPQDLTLDDVIRALHDALARGVQAMSDADMAHSAELADDDEPRAARDACIAKLRAAIVTLRTNLTHLYGSEILSAFAIPNELPSEPARLLQSARNIESQLRERPITETPKLQGFALDPMAIADGLAAMRKALEASLADVTREAREAQLTLQCKNEAMRRWSSLYQGVANVATGLFLMANQRPLAERVRPTARRRAGLPEQDDTPPAETAA